MHSKLTRIVSQIELGVGIVSLIGMVIIVNLNIFFRYFLKDPLHAWYLDLSLLFNLYMTFFVISYLYRHGQDIMIDLVVKRLPSKWQLIIELIIQVVIGIVLILILSFAWSWQRVQWYTIAGGLGIPYSFFSLSFIIGSILMFISNLGKIGQPLMLLLRQK